MNRIWSDLVYAARFLIKNRGFSAVAVLSLGVAIGINTTIFSLINGSLLRPPVSLRPDEYLCLYTGSRDAGRDFRPFSLAEFTHLRGAKEIFADASAVSFGQVGLQQGDSFRRAFAFLVTDNFFSLAGVAPAAGRFFAPEEIARGASRPVVVASHALWQRNGQRPDFIGSSLRLNGRDWTVIGVAPAGFSGVSPLLAPDLFLPLGMFSELAPAFGDRRESSDLADPRTFALNVLVRLAPGVSRERADRSLSTLAGTLATAAPDPAGGPVRELVLARPYGVAPMPPDTGRINLVAGMTSGLAALVLVVACLNLANLLLARSSLRAPEIATRVALGATRGRIIRQLLTEGALLALAGGALGVLLSTWAGALLEFLLARRVDDFGFVVTASFQPDLRVLAVTLLGCLAATLAFSLGPALHSSRTDLVRDLRAGGAAARSAGGNRLFAPRSVLLIGQAAGSFVLLVVAGLFIRAAWQSAGTATGFQTRSVALAELDLSLAAPAHAHRPPLAEVLERLRDHPAVASAGFSTLPPYANAVQTALLRLPHSSASNSKPVGAVFSTITPGYLESLSVPLLRGRDFTAAEAANPEARVCLIDEGTAARLFPDGNPLGQILRIESTHLAQGRDCEVVGVVARHSQDIADRTRPFRRVFLPLASGPQPVLFLTAKARGAGDATAARLALIEVLRDRADALPIVAVKSMDDHLGHNVSLWQTRLGAAFFGVFGAAAMALAMVGIYGVTSYAVACRTREFGIRMALGADRAAIIRLVLDQGGRQLACAMLTGVPLALLAGRGLASFLAGVEATDLSAFALAGGVLCFSVLAACWLPARRAARVDPIVALRAD